MLRLHIGFTLKPLVSLVIAESALEVIPKEIMHHSSVKNYAQKLGKRPSETLLDRSYHHSAMIHYKLNSASKRGRPDIVHFGLMEALYTPLFFNHILDVYVHTINDKVILVAENLKIPKSYFRFEGLMMKLFKDKVIMKKSNNHDYNDAKNKMLLELHDDTTFEYLINNIVKPDKLIGLTSIGVRSTVEGVASKLVNDGSNNHFAFVIGGFPKGHFSHSTSKLFDYSYSISEVGLEAHIVIARILYECEKTLLIY